MAKHSIRGFFTNESNRDKRTILYYFICFLVITLGVLLGFHDFLKKNMDAYFGQGFYLAILSAFIENFAFFGFIGLIAQFISMKAPEDQDFERTIEAVANASFVNPKAKAFLVAQNRKLLAFNELADVKLVIKEINEEKEAFKIYTIFNNTIINMCRDVDYSLIETPASAEAEIFIDGIGGEITHLSLSDTTLHTREAVVEEQIVTLKPANPIYNYVIRNFNISANSRALWKYSFWLWGKMQGDSKIPNNWFFVGVNRFTPDFRVKIINETDYKISLNIRHPDHSENAPAQLKEYSAAELLPGQEVVLCTGVILNPYDKFELFFSNFVK